MSRKLWHSQLALWVAVFSWFNTLAQSPTKDDLSRAYSEGSCAILNLNVSPSDSNDAEWYYLLGLCEKQTGDYISARKHLIMSDSLGASTYRVSYLLNLAGIHAQLGEEKAAINAISRAAKLGFTNHRALERAEFNPLRDHPEFLQIKSELEPSFDTWTSLFLFVSLQALFVCIALFSLKTGRKDANKLLGVLMLCFAIILFSYVLYWTRYNSVFPYLNAWFHPLLFLTGPLFYLYIRNLARHEGLSNRDLVHFLPPIMVAVCIYPILLGAYSDTPFSGLLSPNKVVMISFGTNAILKVVYLGVYLGLSIRVFYQSKMGHLTSWYKTILLSFGGYYMTIVVYYVLVNFSFFNPTWDYMISFAMSFFVFVVSFLGYIYPQALAGVPLKKLTNPFKYRNSGLTEKAEVQLRDELLKAMEEKELYRLDISLDDLAEKVNSNRHSVSLVINKYFEMNYFDFVNKFRVEYVKKVILLPENSSTPIISLAYDAGFNNKATFNKAFKKHVGCTPMSYRATKGKIEESI